MLSVQNVSYSINGRQLLHSVKTAFSPGQLSLIIGPNGAGKSTFIKLLCRQLLPGQGQILMDGKNLNEYSSRQLGIKRSVLSQSIEVNFPLKVWEVVMMGRYPHYQLKPSAKDNEAVEAAMRYFDVWDMAERDFTTLSGGEKQRVHFSRVLCQVWYAPKEGCRYLLMDEPLTFLDVYYQFQFMHKIKELLSNSDMVVIGVVHDLNLAVRFADKIILINSGTIVAEGKSSEVLTEGNIQAAYQLKPVVMYDKARDMVNLFFE